MMNRSLLSTNKYKKPRSHFNSSDEHCTQSSKVQAHVTPVRFSRMFNDRAAQVCGDGNKMNGDPSEEEVIMEGHNDSHVTYD